MSASKEQTWDEIPWHPNVFVVKAVSSVLGVYKPCGILSHPNCANGFRQALIKASYDLKKEAYKVDGNYIYLLNRLDSPTSGLILLSTDLATAQNVRKLFRTHRVQKNYLAVVKGYFPEKSALWYDRLDVHHKDTYVRTYCTDACGLQSKTKVRLLKTVRLQHETLSLLKLQPLTGRTHQLRVQCATRRFPILGDKTYGDFAWNRRMKATRLYLHAEKIAFNLPNITFEASCSSGWDFQG